MAMKLKVGIFFGGPSRERELSYRSGRTVYDYLDRGLFEPVPIFVDHHRRLIRLDQEALYREGIRDFYPAVELLPPSPHAFRIYADSLGELPDEDRDRLIERIGRRLEPAELPQLIDLGFIALPGAFGSDGELQALLDAHGIPYTGSGAACCRTLADYPKRQRQLQEAGLPTLPYRWLDRATWVESGAPPTDALRFPIRVLPAQHPTVQDGTQVDSADDAESLAEAIDKAFFREIIPVEYWKGRSRFDRIDHLQLLTDLEYGLGFPIDVQTPGAVISVYHPEQLLQYLDEQAARLAPGEAFILEGQARPQQALLEEAPPGQAFSCLVVERQPGDALPLLPVGSVPGHDTKDDHPPLDLPNEQLDAIRQVCQRAFSALNCRGLARVDGLLATDGEIYVRHLAPIPAFTPLSLPFRQLALLGLTPSQSLNFLLQQALAGDTTPSLTTGEDRAAGNTDGALRQKVAILFGGAAVDRQAALDAARNVFAKLAGTADCDPIPLFLTADTPAAPLYQLPSSLFLEPTAEVMERRLRDWTVGEVEEDIRAEGRALTRRYGGPALVLSPQRLELKDLAEWVDHVFIALPGPPATDGRLQAELERLEVPYSGSDAAACATVFNQHHALEVLQKNGISVPRLHLLRKRQYQENPDGCFERIERELGYPLYARPAQSQGFRARRQLNNREELQAYTRLLFRPEGHEGLDARYVLRLRPREAFPRQDELLLEGKVGANGAIRFLPVTAGLRTIYDEAGRITYQVLPPSERLREDEPLTLEEQYQVTDGRYCTPARFSPSAEMQEEVDAQVRETFEEAARILNLQGCAQIDGLVRVLPTGRAESIVTGLQTQPLLNTANPLFRQAVAEGFSPASLLAGIVEFSIARSQQPEQAEEAPLDTQEPAWVGTVQEATPAFPPPEEAPAPPPPEEIEWKKRFRPSSSNFTMTIGRYLKEFFSQVGGFLFSPFFLKNLILLISFGVLLLLLTNWMLKLYTHHGESLEVHSYVGMQLNDAEKMARSRSFQIVISDSIFRVDQPPNIVLEQYPAPFSRVKEDRRIYLTVTSSTAPKVALPPLEGAYNYEAYRRKLLRLDIESTIRERQYDNKLEENTILYLYHDGRKITESDLRRGVKVPKGSTVEFVVTERLTDQVPAPDLICKRYQEASFLITATNLVMGQVYGDVQDQNSAFIYQQDPEPGVMMRMGEQIDIYLSSRRPRRCPEVEETPFENQEESIEEDPFGTGE